MGTSDVNVVEGEGRGGTWGTANCEQHRIMKAGGSKCAEGGDLWR